MEQVRIGIVGIGNMGSSHASYINKGEIDGAVLTAVCDTNPARLEWAKSNLNGDIACYDDHKQLINSGKVDAIIIATPHYDHPVVGIDAFNAGLHVLCEKPVGVYTKVVEDFMAAAKASGKVFSLMFNQRTNNYYQKMREMVQSGEMGQLKRCVWLITDWYRTQAYYDSGGWRATWSGEGGGVLINQCPHNLDLWQWIFGMPNRIRAFCSFGKYHNIEVEDDVTAYAEYPNGATGVFITTTGECPGTNRLEISGSRGKLVYEGGILTFTKLDVDERDYCFNSEQGFAKPKIEKIDIKCEGTGRQHKGITQNFTDHILGRAELLAPGYEGINSLSLSNAMLLSTWKDDWVDLPNDGEEFWAELQKRIASSKAKDNVVDKVADLSDTYGTPSK